MQSIFSFHNCSGLPLCVSGITHRLSFPFEIVDHDRRREAMKKQRSEARERFDTNQDMGNRRSLVRDLEEVREGEMAGDLGDLINSYKGCTAKAA